MFSTEYFILGCLGPCNRLLDVLGQSSREKSFKTKLQLKKIKMLKLLSEYVN